MTGEASAYAIMKESSQRLSHMIKVGAMDVEQDIDRKQEETGEL